MLFSAILEFLQTDKLYKVCREPSTSEYFHIRDDKLSLPLLHNFVLNFSSSSTTFFFFFLFFPAS